MAPVAFRLLMASDKSSTPPPPTFNGIYTEIGCIPGVVNSTSMSAAQANQTILPSSTSQYFTAYFASNGNAYGCMITEQGGYNTTGTPLVIQSSITGGVISSDSVSSTGYLVAYTTFSVGYSLQVAYLTSSGTTLTLATSPTTYFSAVVTPSNLFGVCVLDSSNALIIGGSSSAQVLNLISPTALTQTATQVTTIAMNTNSYPLKMLGMSSTLGALIYIASDNTTITCIGLDRSGSTVTVNSPQSMATTANSPSFGVSLLTSSTFLLSYTKNNTTLAARVITVASGGVVTVGTEYTFVPGVTQNSTVLQSAALTSTAVVISWRGNTAIAGNFANAVNVSISGSTITFDTNIYPLVTGNSVTSTGCNLIPISSTKIGMVYGFQSGNFSGFPSAIGYSSTADYQNSLPTWAATFAGNMAVSPAFPFGSTQPIPSKILNLGSNRSLIVYSSTSGTQSSGWHTIQMDTLATNITAATSDVLKATSAGNYVAGACRIYADDVSNTRVLGFYYDASDNVQFGVIYIDPTGVTTMNTTATNFTNTLNASTFNSLVVNAAPNVSLYIQGSGATISGTYKLQASVITTSGSTVSSPPALTTIDTTVGSSFNMLPLTAQAIDANTIVVIYQTDISSGAHRAYNVGIIDITGGTPSLVTSAPLTPTAGMGSVATGHFTVGTNRGVLLYQSSSGTSTIGIGFSYTTTSVTVSASPVTIGLFTHYTIAAIETNNTCGVSGTELMASLANVVGSIQWFLVTTPDINTITVATGIDAPATFQTTRTAMIPAENQDALMCATYGSSGGLIVYAAYLFKS